MSSHIQFIACKHTRALHYEDSTRWGWSSNSHVHDKLPSSRSWLRSPPTPLVSHEHKQAPWIKTKGEEAFLYTVEGGCWLYHFRSSESLLKIRNWECEIIITPQSCHLFFIKKQWQDMFWCRHVQREQVSDCRLYPSHWPFKSIRKVRHTTLCFQLRFFVD